MEPMFFEDFEVGQEFTTKRRTITETDIVNFACFSGDYSRLHMDRHYAAQTMFKDRIAHGLLGASMAPGMLSLDAPHILGRANPDTYLYSFEINYRDVIKLDDTIRVKWLVIETCIDPHQESFGLVKTAFHIFNQEDRPVYDGTITLKVGIKTSHKIKLPLIPGTPWDVTEFIPDTDKIYYLEDYTPEGEGGETEGRTITEADVINFAGLTGDYNPQYVDATFAKKSMVGERIAHGMLGFNISFASWLRKWSRIPLPQSDIAGHLNDKIRFLAPIKIGDTIRCRYKTIDWRVSKSKPQLGLITFGLQVINQRDEVVQEGEVIMMMPSKQKVPKVN